MDGSKCRSRRRGRRRREDTPLDDDDLGEGCSYLVHSPYTQIGCPSGLQDSSTGGRSNHRQVRRSKHIACTCTPSPPSNIPRAAAILLAAAAAVSHASASPVEVKVMSSSSRLDKGKQRASSDDTVHGLDCSQDTQSSTLDCITPLRIPPDSDEAQSLLFDANARGRSQALEHLRKNHLKRSNTPDGVPSHYEYIDGEWVPSSDWSLNGLDGNRHASSLSGAGGSAGNGDSDGQSNSEDSSDAGTDGPSTRQNNASPTAANDGDIPDDNALASTTLGWAKSTNAILGVDIDTSLTGSIGSATRSSSSAISSMITRTNMATYTPISSSSPAIPVASSSSTSTSSRTSNNNSNTGQAYDFSRDVPNGWVSDGRTAAYAVPVIIGLSIFLACIIFSLILVLLRMNKSRKRRRKAVLNGKLKLSEEGKLPPTRPTSPVLSQQDGGDNDTDEGVRGISSSVNRRRSSGDGERHSIEGEEEKHASRRRIGRKWTPSLNNGALRKRRKRIAQLFKSNGNEPVKEIIVIDGQEEQAQDTTQNNLRRSRSISTISSSAAASVASREQDQETLSRVVSNTSIRSATRQNSNEDRAYIRPPSLRVDTSDSLPSTHPTGRASALTSPAHPATSPHTQLHEETQNQRQYHARHDSIDASDHHAVPVPSVGPPAYMQPSTPAYTRSAAGPSSSSSSSVAAETGGLTAGAIHTSGYMSAVSTPGLSAGLDEKRALLGIAEGNSGTIEGNDAFGNQRRYEHLYNSREGEEARIEQMTGAPSFSSPSSSSTTFNTCTPRTLPLSTITTSSSSRFGMNGYNHYEDVGTAEENDEAFARRTQIEAIEEHRRELQASLAGHVAISDKETLGRLRMLGSAPIIPSTSSSPSAEDDEEQTADAEASPSVSVPSSTRRGRHMLEASAPSLDEAEEEELQAYLTSQQEQASSQPQQSTSSSSIQQSSMLLPAPPRPISSSRQALDLIPQVDEKTRLRQAEERIAASSFSPIFTSFNQKEEEDHPQMVPSAPPAMDNASVYEASTPSAPVFEGDINEENQVEYVPSAPPLEELTIHHPSVPSYVVEDEEEEEGEHDSENRPYNEGVI